MPDNSLLEVEHLTKVFRDRRRGDVVAVDDVSFRLGAGESLAIVGESGSGKSTVSRMIVGLESVTSGRIVVEGADWTQISGGSARRKERAKFVQMVFQDPYHSLDLRQSVGDGIGELLSLHFDLSKQQRDERVAALLAQVGLHPSKAASLPTSLSGGERQRVAIARALAPEPRILILDEAVAALDVSIQAQILNLLVDIRNDTGVAYLFVSHDLSVVRQVSEQVVVMRGGVIVERGATADVFVGAQHPYTQLLLDSAPKPGWKPQRRIELPAVPEPAQLVYAVRGNQ